MYGQEKTLHSLLEPGVNALGYELLGVRFLHGSTPAILRLYIDHENGITLDDCAAVSGQVSGTLDVEDCIRENYTLEVSSPGTERPLFSAEQYLQFCGRTAKLRMTIPVHGQRNFTGVLKGIKNTDVLLVVNGTQEHLPLENIASARLVVDSNPDAGRGVKKSPQCPMSE